MTVASTFRHAWFVSLDFGQVSHPCGLHQSMCTKLAEGLVSIFLEEGTNKNLKLTSSDEKENAFFREISGLHGQHILNAENL